MTDTGPSVAPILSTPDTHVFEDPTTPIDTSKTPKLSDEQLHITYEIKRTVDEIRAGRWQRIALQFPDHMLIDAPRVYRALRERLRKEKSRERDDTVQKGGEGVSAEGNGAPGSEGDSDKQSVVEKSRMRSERTQDLAEESLCILADTSYGSCCVDEIAAEHMDADVVVHYGRSCLSSTARLPVVYVFTTQPLALEPVIQAFNTIYPDRNQRVVLMADIPYQTHVQVVHKKLREEGYMNVYPTQIVQDPSSALPNRTVPPDMLDDSSTLQSYQLFHISQPPQSLLLVLASRIGAIHIYPTDPNSPSRPLQASSAIPLRRRYALITRVSTVPIFGILVNTLSVKNYLDMIDHVRSMITAAGKKSYTFVVGKINPAKIANFAEVGAWVVVGCWESSLIEDGEFWKPLVTPFELEMALKGDERRIWDGRWENDFQKILDKPKGEDREDFTGGDEEANGNKVYDDEEVGTGRLGDEEDSAPPEFDLRTGRYVSHSRPMALRLRQAVEEKQNGKGATRVAHSLIKRAHGDLARVGGEVSPGAEFLRSRRTWQGLGSDFGVEHGAGGATVEQGRSGIARGYTVGDDKRN